MQTLVPIKIPITFLADVPVKALRMDDAALVVRLGLQNRTPAAARQYSWKWRKKNQIDKVDGMYSVDQVEAAVRSEFQLTSRRR